MPLLVLDISSMDEAAGVVVPMPALPVAGNVLVCADALAAYIPRITAAILILVFMILIFWVYNFLTEQKCNARKSPSIHNCGLIQKTRIRN